MKPFPTATEIQEAARLIQRGGLVVFPTETVYGLGADARNAAAVERIFAAKGRPADNPLIVHVAALGAVESVACSVPDVACELFRRFAPGPLTLVLSVRPEVPRSVTAGLGSVAVRIPSHPVARALLEEAGCPIAAPSANRSGEPSPTTVGMARKSLSAVTGLLFLDGGPCEVGLESTVARVTGRRVTVLRPGAVSADDLRLAVPGVEVVDAPAPSDGRPPESPGLRHRHYRPRAAVCAVEADAPAPPGPVHWGEQSFAVIGISSAVDGWIAAVCGSSSTAGLITRRASNAANYARSLYRWFAELDAIGVQTIVAILPPSGGIGSALRDRIGRASGE